MPSNELYLTVLPLIHLGNGLTEQSLTVFPDRNFATEFFIDEVDHYIKMFKSREELLIGGHVKGYAYFKEPTDDGRVIVRVVQDVS